MNCKTVKAPLLKLPRLPEAERWHDKALLLLLIGAGTSEKGPDLIKSKSEIKVKIQIFKQKLFFVSTGLVLHPRGSASGCIFQECPRNLYIPLARERIALHCCISVIARWKCRVRRGVCSWRHVRVVRGCASCIFTSSGGASITAPRFRRESSLASRRRTPTIADSAGRRRHELAIADVCMIGWRFSAARRRGNTYLPFEKRPLRAVIILLSISRAPIDWFQLGEMLRAKRWPLIIS